MADQKSPRITQADVQSLTAKLKQLLPTLMPGEQQALRTMAARAAIGKDQDVRGYNLDVEAPNYFDPGYGSALDDYYSQSMPDVMRWDEASSWVSRI